MLLEAARVGDVSVVEKLIEGEAISVNSMNRYGNTALHFAAKNGNIATIEALIAQGANVNALNNDGSTALHWAAYRGQTTVIEVLVANGANLGAVDNYGTTPLGRVRHTDIAALKFLRSEGALLSESKVEHSI